MKKQGQNLLLGTRKGLLWFKRAGSGFELAHIAHAGVPIAYAKLDPRTNTAWACLDHGHWGQKLSRSRDGGATWEEVAAPKYPDDATYLTGWFGMERKTAAATLRYLWCFEHGGADQPGRLYLGTEPGGLFVSDDDGASWRLNEGLWNHKTRLDGYWSGGGRDNAGVHSILVDPRDSKRIVVGVSCGGIFDSRDDGASWRLATKGMRNDYSPDPTSELAHDPHFVSWCASSPDHMWQQSHCGIFASDDGAQEWRDVSEPKGGAARFGFPIAVDERDPKTAWVVPATADQDRSAFGHALCVARTRDGGKTWQTLRKGLPQTQCFDIVYRHGLDIAGDTLVFGSTTGNAYFSADRGESWQLLGNHFAPIYSVRID